jgi:voltage-gated potassium channel
VLEIEKRAEGSELTDVNSLYWWWLETVTGIGAGVDPVTTEARIIATFVVFAGFVLLGLFISEFSEIIRMYYARFDEGNIKISYKNHIVIFGYTSLTAGVIKLLRNHFGANVKIVLVSNEVESNPFPGQADFIHDNPINIDTFYDANVSSATAAIILANDRFRDPDTYSLVIASAIERSNSKVTTIVEVTGPENKDFFKKAGIDAFMSKQELLSDLLDGVEMPKLMRVISKESNLERRDTASVDTELL